MRVREWETRTAGSKTAAMAGGRASVVERIQSEIPRAIAPISSTATSETDAPAPTSSHLAVLFLTMYTSHPSSKHCFDLYQLTKDLPHTKEGTLERLQLLVRRLYACGYSSTQQPNGATSPPSLAGSSLPEKTTGLGPPGDIRNITCQCAGARPTAPPQRAPPPSPGIIAAGTSAPTMQSPPLPSRPQLVVNTCYLLFYQSFLRSNGFHDLWFILSDATPGSANACAAVKRWALRGMWAVFEYVKPLLSSSVVPLTTTPHAATSPAAAATSGNLRSHHSGHSSSSSLDLGHAGLGMGVVSHAQLTGYSLVRCRSKLLTVWDEEALSLAHPQLFRGNFGQMITSLIEPHHRSISPIDGQANPVLIHESLIDALFELAVGTIRLDMVYSTTTTLEPIKTYLNEQTKAPLSTTPSSAAVAGAKSPLSPSSFSPGPKREQRVQVLNKPIINLQVIPIILHLLPYTHISSAVLTLENFTWLLNNQSVNIRELLWNLECSNGNFGGNLFQLLNLANQYMEAAGANKKEEMKAAGGGAAGAAAAGAKGAASSAAKPYSSNPSASLAAKGAWDIFLDTSLPESHAVQAGDHQLVFNLTITLFTTLHYHSMLIHLNASNLFAIGTQEGAGLTTGGAQITPTTPSSDNSISDPYIPSGSHTPSNSSLDTSERVKFRSSLLYRTMESLRLLNGWNEATTSVFRVMIICLLNVLRSEARTFTSNYELSNSAANNFALNQFLVLLYVIEEFIFFRPLAPAVAQDGTVSNNFSNDDDEEYAQVGLHFDFGDDFDWQLDTAELSGISAPTPVGGAPVTGMGVSSSNNLGRVLDVPVIDKILDVFSRLEAGPTASESTGRGGQWSYCSGWTEWNATTNEQHQYRCG